MKVTSNLFGNLLKINENTKNMLNMAELLLEAK